MEFTIHFWTLVTQIVALSGFFAFLWKVYQGIKRVIQALLTLLDEHREMYRWYQSRKLGG